MAAEAPIVIERSKELTYLLCQAAELEHGLMCEYLYAASPLWPPAPVSDLFNVTYDLVL